MLQKQFSLGIATLITISFLLSGCSMLHPLKKPDIGPAGKPVETKANPPFVERFTSPPAELYDLEATAGGIFEGICNKKWAQAEQGLTTLRALWLETLPKIGDKKGTTGANEALEQLTTAITNKKDVDSYQSLTKFMSSISDIGKSYKLSPLSDIIGVSNGIRTVTFYVENNDWRKAIAKMKELESTWQQAKPNMESVGIWSKLTTTHSVINQMKGAIEAENKASVEENIADINESMGYIREYYRGK